MFVCVLDPVVILFGSKCSHSIGMHLEGVIVVIQDLSLNAGIIIYSSLICICIYVHKHIHTSTGGYCAISQNIISALDI